MSLHHDGDVSAGVTVLDVLQGQVVHLEEGFLVHLFWIVALDVEVEVLETAVVADLAAQVAVEVGFWFFYGNLDVLKLISVADYGPSATWPPYLLVVGNQT